MLRITNRELLKLQFAARELASKDAKALPVVTVDCRDRAFGLLAEFLDASALSFQEGLQEELQQCNQDFITVLATWIPQGIEKCFGFLARSTPELAVPLDPKAQAL